jgi:hypothetical protein
MLGLAGIEYFYLRLFGLKAILVGPYLTGIFLITALLRPSITNTELENPSAT